MAEGLARKMLGSLAEAESAGTGAMNGRGAAKDAVEIMRSRFGIDLSRHQSRNVSDVPMDDFDYIVPMDHGVADDLRETFPQISARVVRSWNIDDPFGKGIEAYEKSAEEIYERVKELSASLRQVRP